MSCFQVNMLARILCKINSLVPSNLPLTRGTDTKLRNFAKLQFLNDKIDIELYQRTPFGTWQFDKIGVLVNVMIQK